MVIHNEYKNWQSNILHLRFQLLFMQHLILELKMFKLESIEHDYI